MSYKEHGSIKVTFPDGTDHIFTAEAACAGLDPQDVVEVSEVESEFSSTSTMPVQNKTITNAMEDKADLENGKVPSSQLPSYVDDVIEYPSTSDFPATGEAGKIYVALDTSFTYRWSGSTYVRVNEPDLSNYYTKAQVDALLSTSYSAASTYAVNDAVMHDNKLYRCIVAINVPEQWNVAHWQETTIVALIDNSIYGTINQGY